MGYALDEVKEVTDETQSLVTERFNLAETTATTQVAAAEACLTALASIFAGAEMPATDINYDFQEITLDSGIPDAPDPPADSRPAAVGFPTHAELTGITVPTVTIPEYTLVAPSGEIAYNEESYESDLNEDLKSALIDFIEDGGTGLGEDIEDALWARGRDKQATINERTYNEAEEYFAARNYSLPAGALGGRLTEALNEIGRADAQLNYEISIEQARLARAQSEYSLNAALTLEGQDKEQFNNVANRAFNYAKAAAEIILALFDIKVKAYLGEMEGARIEAETNRIGVEALTASNKGITDIYDSDIKAYVAKLQREISLVETAAKVYGFEVAGYEGKARIAIADLEAQIKVYQGNIDQANNQTALSLKEAELTMQSYLGALQLTSEAMKAGGNISAQIAAAALSAVNASASLGAHAASSYGAASNYNDSISDSVSEVHHYDETSP